MNIKLRHFTSIALFVSLGVATGCPGDDSPAEGTNGTTSTGDGSTGPGMTSTPTMTTDAPVTGDDSGTSTSGPSTISVGSESSDGEMCVPMGELGDSCLNAMCDCISGSCYVVGPLGGVCSECEEDADCAATTGFGCNFGNPLTGTAAVCSKTGDIGESCQTTDACAEDLFCSTLIDVPGIITAATCSECEEDGDCANAGDVCTPTYDIANIGGNYFCAAPGSVPNDSGCNLTGDGSECESGQCAPAALMDIPVLAVCSPCNEDSDCGGGMTCQLPVLELQGTSLVLVPGTCM